MAVFYIFYAPFAVKRLILLFILIIDNEIEPAHENGKDYKINCNKVDVKFVFTYSNLHFL